MKQVARYYIGATASAPTGVTGQGPAKRKRESDHATAMDLPLSPALVDVSQHVRGGRLERHSKFG